MKRYHGSLPGVPVATVTNCGAEQYPPEPEHAFSLPWPSLGTAIMKYRWRSLSRLQRSFCLIILLLLALYTISRIYQNQPSYQEAAVDHRTTKTKVVRTEPKQSAAEVTEKEEAQQSSPDEKAGRERKKKPKAVIFTGPQNDRQRAVVNATRHAWSQYKQYAWGADEIKPTSKGSKSHFGLGLQIVDSLDTLWIMGLKEEFVDARDWVADELDLTGKRYINVFETTIRALGGLLSAYHLSGENIFLDKAQELGRRLLPAFESPTGIPYSDISLGLAKAKVPSWAESSLAEVATLQLEFRDLSRSCGDSKFEDVAFDVSKYIHNNPCHDNLCGMFIHPKTGKLNSAGSTLTMGARADSYYEYLLKQWLQIGKPAKHWLAKDYEGSMAAVKDRLWGESKPKGYGFVGERVGQNSFSPKMDHLVCFLAGTLALGHQNGFPAEHMQMARDLAHTCFRMYNTTRTGLAPEIAHFNLIDDGSTRDIKIKTADAHSLLRPETVESLFYLYRLTGEHIYQEWGWSIFQAIERHARVQYGYSSIINVEKVPVQYRNSMETFLTAETFKYLYLLFDDTRSLLPLDKWVFNTEAHPLPIYTD